MSKMNTRRRLLRSAALVGSFCVAFWSNVALAQVQTYAFDIPAEPLSNALREFARVSGQQIIFTNGLVAGKSAPALHGNYSADDALSRLLVGTTLVIERSPSGAIMVRPKNVQAASNEEAADTLLDGPIETVVVTGTHIRGAAPAGSPLQNYSRNQIDQTGVATLNQFMTTLPQNLSQASPMVNLTASAPSGGYSQLGSNAFSGAFANIHGLGPDATLTLLDGNRIAPAGASGDFVDLSLIPLAAVDHIEVLSDGASAIYGSDAIAGVVNIALRHDFDGAQSMVQFGGAPAGGADELTASQLFGRSWTGGNILGVYEFDEQYGLTAGRRATTAGLPANDTIVPSQTRNSVFVTGNQQLPLDVTASVTGFYSNRNYRSTVVLVGLGSFPTAGGSRQFGGTFSLQRALFGEWTGTLTASSSWSKQQNTQAGIGGSSSHTTADLALQSLALRADGPLFDLGAGDVRAAIGGEVRRESLKSSIIASANPGVSDLHRAVSGLYAELSVPLVSERNAVPGVESLALSLAGRFDSYGDSGSSFNPKIGASWSPTHGLAFRGSYSTAYRAPTLSQLAPSPLSFTYPLPNAAAPGGVTDTLLDEAGGNPDLRPEKATTYSAGFDAAPDAVPGLSLHATYFQTRFNDRIALPPIIGSFISVYSQLATLSPYINMSPTPAEIAAYFGSPGFLRDYAGLGQAGVRAIFHYSPTNIAASSQSGIDAQLAYAWTTDVGSFGVNTDATYMFENSYRPAGATPQISLLDIFGEPLRFKARGGLNWANWGFSSSLFLNYAASYLNPFTTPRSPIASWTTVDLHTSYQVGEADGRSLFDGVSLAFSVQNLFDQAPPHVVIPPSVSSTNPGFDPANASPVGRLLSLSLTKRW